MDEFNRECLAIDVAKKLTSEDMLGRLEREAFGTLLEAKVLIERTGRWSIGGRQNPN